MFTTFESGPRAIHGEVGGSAGRCLFDSGPVIGLHFFAHIPDFVTDGPVHEMAPRPFWEAPWVANIIFGCGCKRGFHSSTFYFSLHFSTDSLTNFVETRPEQ